jgi:hypothetical protein
MSLDNINTVDAIGVDTLTNRVVLTIADYWDWDEEEEEHEHLLALQAKLNAYFEFIETDQILVEYPSAKGRQAQINIIFRCQPPSCAVNLVSEAGEVASRLNVLVSSEVYPGSAF